MRLRRHPHPQTLLHYEGQVVEVIVGTMLTLTLDSNPTTGFSWQLADISDPTVLEEVGHEFQAAEAEAGGAREHRGWQLRTKQRR